MPVPASLPDLGKIASEAVDSFGDAQGIPTISSALPWSALQAQAAEEGIIPQAEPPLEAAPLELTRQENLPSSASTLPSPVSRGQQQPGPESIQSAMSPGYGAVMPTDKVQVTGNGQTVNIFAREVDVRVVLADLSDESQVNIVISPDVTGTVSTSIRNVPLWKALDAILRINGLVWTEHDGIIYVSRPGAVGEGGTARAYGSRALLGQSVEVFDLNYVAGLEVLPIVKTLLSAAGTAHMHQVDASSVRQTRERIVVEDFADRVRVISDYLARVDIPPQQVLIEAHVLQVTLDKDQRHGVNLNGLARVAGGRVQVRAQGFANGDASPGFMMGVDGTDLDGMLEALRSNSYVRTLAAPKVMVVNGQEARIQIGSKFGYFETTTTQTGTFQNVNFLDIGVVLTVTPTITHDGQIMLHVLPKVSGGRVNAETGLPEEDTTEAQTTVILPDGKGMIIGGLIKEQDEHSRSWIPWLGEQPIIGRLFRRSSDGKQRIEVIIALTPHIVPYSDCLADREGMAFIQATNTTGIISGGYGPNTPANEYMHPSPAVIHTNDIPMRLDGIDLPVTDFVP